ncbi:MAG: relaxase/mobilization nuclease domain-containing protein, partial [Rhodobacterales bacterium]|nr:relaxase/mobilization nuclease domain-containing protein [Rhodobacterales bacterium]
MTASSFYDDILIRANRGMGRTSVGGGAKPRGERVWKSLTSTGSAFVKRIPGAGVQHTRQLAGQLAYVNGKAKGAFGFATGIAAEGDAFAQADLEQLMDAWSQDWKGRPRNGHTSHMVLSFPDDVSNANALMIAREWCKEMFEDEAHVSDAWEYVAALHTDTENPHVHVILNNRGLGGTWFSISSEGVFTPQMMRDRMTDIADDYGVRLESLSRADRGLYREPITSAAVHAAREGRVLSTEAVKESVTADWRRADMHRTAQLYSTLADFAVTIGAPMIANRAYISAAALFAGQEIPKGQMMDIELDVTADREDIRTSLIGWAEQNREQIDALPQGERTEIMGKIDAALNIIETDVTPDLTADTIWTAFKNTPSSYLIPDADALEARAALYVDEADSALLNEFVNENVLDTYLVTGEVPSKFAAVMPAVAEAYEEMHSHRLEEIPKEMKAYVRKAASMGIDPLQMQERLINAIDDPVENVKMERGDIAKIVAARGVTVFESGIGRDRESSIIRPEQAYVTAYHKAEADYRDLQLALGDVEEKIIADSKVYDRDGVAQVLQNIAHTATTTGHADLADSAVGRHVLTAFVA